MHVTELLVRDFSSFMYGQWIWRPMLCHTSSRMNWNRLTVLRRIRLLRIIDFKPKLNMAKSTHTAQHSQHNRHRLLISMLLLLLRIYFFLLSLSIRRSELSWLDAVHVTFALYVLFPSSFFRIWRTRALERFTTRSPVYNGHILSSHCCRSHILFCSVGRTIQRCCFERSSPACQPDRSFVW